jgi:putative ATP-binding cassette transporter
MWTPASASEVKGSRIGMSWFLGQEKGSRIVSHGGGDDGFRTFVCLLPDRNQGFVLMMNTDHGPLDKIRELTLTAILENRLP